MDLLKYILCLIPERANFFLRRDKANLTDTSEGDDAFLSVLQTSLLPIWLCLNFFHYL